MMSDRWNEHTADRPEFTDLVKRKKALKKTLLLASRHEVSSCLSIVTVLPLI